MTAIYIVYLLALYPKSNREGFVGPKDIEFFIMQTSFRSFRVLLVGQIRLSREVGHKWRVQGG